MIQIDASSVLSNMKAFSAANDLLNNTSINYAKIIPIIGRAAKVQLSLSDIEYLLMQIAKDKSRDAFKKLFDFYYPKVIGYGLKGGLNKEQSADMAQEVMLKIWRNAHQYNNDKGNINTWVYAIVRNQKYDLLRKQGRDPLSIISANDIFDDEYLQQEDEDYNSEEIFHLAYTKEMINKLSIEQQEVLNGIYQEGLTQKEFAEQEKIPLGTVKSRIRLAIKNLKIILEEK